MWEVVAIAILFIREMFLGGLTTSGPPAKGWRDIEALHSTRQDVERLLGAPRSQQDCTDNLCTYSLPDMNVLVHYSKGDCASGRGAWDVPVDTVLYVTVYPKPSPRWSSLRIDKAKLMRREVGHIKQVVSFINESEGFFVEVDEGIDEVLGFYYVPSAKDKHLRCPSKA